MTYAAADFLVHDDIQLTQNGLILIAVLRGGDYSDGLHGCGVATARGLARAGFGDSLVHAARTLTRGALEDFLVGWRQQIRDELRTNASGRLDRKSPALAKTITEDFPNIDVVLAYTNPITSEAKGPGHRNTVVDWNKEPDLGKIAGLCEMYFEWGVKHIIIKRFRTVLWPSAVLRILRRAVLIKDKKAALAAREPVTPRKSGKEQRAPPGTPSSMITKHFARFTLNTPRRGPDSDCESDEDDDGERLIVKIHSSRRHPSTDNVLEYRLEIAPAQLVRLCEAGIKGLRTAVPPDLSDSDDGIDDDDDEGGSKKGKKTSKVPPDPESHLRIWMPACMVELVEPELVEDFEGVERQKAEKKAAKGTKGKKKGDAPGAAAKAKKGKPPAVHAVAEEEEESSSDADRPPAKAKITKKNTTSALKSGQNKSTAANKTNVDKAAAGPSKINDFFAAKRTTVARATTKAKTTSSTARVADLFRDSTMGSGATASEMEESSDDELPPASHLIRLPSLVTSSASSFTSAAPKATNASSKTSSSRLIGYLDSQQVPRLSSVSSGPARSKASPPKERTLRPFPMDLDMFKDDEPAETVPAEEDPFTSASKTSCAARTRSRSSLSTASDTDAPSGMERLRKSPRRSEKHSSPRKTPPTTPQKRPPRKEEEEESSDGDDALRPPSPSPLKGRQPTVLSARTHYPGQNVTMTTPRKQEEEEESDRAPSPSPMRRKVLPALSSKPARSTIPRKPAQLPSNLSIISISSGSDTDSPPSKSTKVPPLLLAKKRLVPAKAPTAARPTQPAPPPAGAKKAPRRMYDPEDIIDLT